MFNRKTNIFILLFILIIIAAWACYWIITNNGKEEVATDENDYDEMALEEELREFMISINTVYAHIEEDTIVGNFTGNGLDTLYVTKVVDPSLDRYKATAFYMKSKNPKIPKLELVGIPDAHPKLVNEGDLDGNGTTEVGYLRTWNLGQWRKYDILTLVNYEWRNLIDGEYLSTPQLFRDSGVEIAEPGKKNGTILVHHYYEKYDNVKEEIIFEIHDTIVYPIFSKIEDPFEMSVDSI